MGLAALAKPAIRSRTQNVRMIQQLSISHQSDRGPTVLLSVFGSAAAGVSGEVVIG